MRAGETQIHGGFDVCKQPYLSSGSLVRFAGFSCRAQEITSIRSILTSCVLSGFASESAKEQFKPKS